MNTEKKTITVSLHVDLIHSLSAMVELGCADRREFLNKHAGDNDYTDAQIAQEHYEADCAEEAVTVLAEAFDAAHGNLRKQEQS